MNPTIINGKSISLQIRAELQNDIVRLKTSNNIVPGLATILVGDNPASQVYIRMKNKACEALGLYSRHQTLEASVSQQSLLDAVESLNNDNAIHGILVQLPLPEHLDEYAVIKAISPDKDVDGFHPVSIGNLLIGLDGFKPCTPAGVMKLLQSYGIDPAGKHAVVVGRSTIVGKPLAAMLMQKAPGGNATVTVCHSRTADLKEITRRADILIAAIGQPEMITADMVKPGAVVIDVGMNRVNDPESKRGYRLVGDVDFNGVAPLCSAITPVPGGVGPMTITMLLSNTVESAQRTVER